MPYICDVSKLYKPLKSLWAKESNISSGFDEDKKQGSYSSQFKTSHEQLTTFEGYITAYYQKV